MQESGPLPYLLGSAVANSNDLLLAGKSQYFERIQMHYLSQVSGDAGAHAVALEANQNLESSPVIKTKEVEPFAAMQQEVAKALDVCRQQIMHLLSTSEAERMASLLFQDAAHPVNVTSCPLACAGDGQQCTHDVEVAQHVSPTRHQVKRASSGASTSTFGGTASASTQVDSVAKKGLASISFAQHHMKDPDITTTPNSSQSLFGYRRALNLSQIEETAAGFGGPWKKRVTSLNRKSTLSTMSRVSQMVMGASTMSRLSQILSSASRSESDQTPRLSKTLRMRRAIRSTITGSTPDFFDETRTKWQQLRHFCNGGSQKMCDFVMRHNLQKLLVYMMIVADLFLVVYQSNIDVATVASVSEEHRGSSSVSSMKAHVLFMLITVLFSLECVGHCFLKLWDIKLGPPVMWIMLDLVALVCSWLQMSKDANLAAISRCGRALRLLHMFRLAGSFLKSVRSMMLTIIQILETVFPVVLMLFSVFFLGSLVILSGVQAYAVGEDPDVETLQIMNKEFGSLEISMRTLFSVFVNCKENHDLYHDMISKMNTSYVFFYQVLWFVVYYIVVNVIVGEIADQIAKARKPATEEILAEMAFSEHEHAVRLLEIMRALDTSENGVLSRTEFEGLIEDPFFAMYMDLLNVSAGCLNVLFDSLYHDDRGGVDISIFVEAILAHRGVAYKFEVCSMARQLDLLRTR